MTGPDPASDLERAIDQRVSLVDHDASWAAAFEAERGRLLALLPGVFVDIAHIGSTAVDGLRAKPLIDLLAGVGTMDEARAVNGLLDRIGYTTFPAFNAALTTRQWFMRQAAGRRTHHLHVVVHGGHEWNVRIGFRDRLRGDPALRERYQALKEELARRHADDREAYTEGKSAFIQATVREADPRPD